MIRAATAKAARIDFPCDLAISAVASDADFVAEIVGEMSTRLRQPPAWRSGIAPPDGAVSPLLPDTSRIALVLHQQLWVHDPETQRDAEVLRERLDGRPRSVHVLSLDDAPLPSWLSALPHCDLPATGRARATDFIIDAVTGAGGTVSPLVRPAEPASAAHWPDPPPPFLAQLRAYSALRREMDSIIHALESAVANCRIARNDQTCEVHVTPNRFIARLPHTAVSFSWVTGRGTTIAEGRLMVIAWHGLSSRVRGLAALRSAAAVHERVYRPDASGPQQWYWRADDLTGRPYSSTNLAAQWLARTSVAEEAVQD